MECHRQTRPICANLYLLIRETGHHILSQLLLEPSRRKRQTLTHFLFVASLQKVNKKNGGVPLLRQGALLSHFLEESLQKQGWVCSEVMLVFTV